jgi:hypothetical protein
MKPIQKYINVPVSEDLYDDIKEEVARRGMLLRAWVAEALRNWIPERKEDQRLD